MSASPPYIVRAWIPKFWFSLAIASIIGIGIYFWPISIICRIIAMISAVGLLVYLIWPLLRIEPKLKVIINNDESNVRRTSDAEHYKFEIFYTIKTNQLPVRVARVTLHLPNMTSFQAIESPFDLNSTLQSCVSHFEIGNIRGTSFNIGDKYHLSVFALGQDTPSNEDTLKNMSIAIEPGPLQVELPYFAMANFRNSKDAQIVKKLKEFTVSIGDKKLNLATIFGKIWGDLALGMPDYEITSLINKECGSISLEITKIIIAQLSQYGLIESFEKRMSSGPTRTYDLTHWKLTDFSKDVIHYLESEKQQALEVGPNLP